MATSLAAVDVAILVPDVVAEPARALNAALAAHRPDALRLDDSHLAHITLAQQFVERARLDELHAALDRLLKHEPPLLLLTGGVEADHGTVFVAIEPHPDLLRLHEQVMDALEPFESPEGGSRAFRAQGETIRSRDVDWVRNYREQSAYAHFRPHVTVGHGDRPGDVAPIDFRADRVAVCELGRHCSCRAILREWKLA